MDAKGPAPASCPPVVIFEQVGSVRGAAMGASPFLYMLFAWRGYFIPLRRATPCFARPLTLPSPHPLSCRPAQRGWGEGSRERGFEKSNGVQNWITSRGDAVAKGRPFVLRRSCYAGRVASNTPDS